MRAFPNPYKWFSLSIFSLVPLPPAITSPHPIRSLNLCCNWQPRTLIIQSTYLPCVTELSPHARMHGPFCLPPMGVWGVPIEFMQRAMTAAPVQGIRYKDAVSESVLNVLEYEFWLCTCYTCSACDPSTEPSSNLLIKGLIYEPLTIIALTWSRVAKRACIPSSGILYGLSL